jgi:hypothetical protein
MSDSREAEERLLREVERLRRQAKRQRWVTVPRRYGWAATWVAVAYAYCAQWHDIDHFPAGAASAFLVAVAVAVRWGGMGPGWLAAGLSLGCMWFRFYEPAGITIRLCWFVAALLTPMIVGAPPIRWPLRRVSRQSEPAHHPIWSDRPSR